MALGLVDEAWKMRWCTINSCACRRLHIHDKIDGKQVMREWYKG